MNPLRTAQTEVREPNDNMGDSSEADESDHDIESETHSKRHS